jgi:ATP-dependent Clp protease ATP-binding subunit ClpB
MITFLNGPSRVGKTLLGKETHEYLFDDDTALVRLNGSEYSDAASVNKLIGAPAGYVGFEKGGLLTEALQRKSPQVVLIEEVEKFDPAVFNAMLQVLDSVSK